MEPSETWPALPYEDWKDTYATLHLWTQIVGKVRLARTPWVNHSWHVTLYPTARGLTTSSIPHGRRTFDIQLDFHAHELRVTTSEGDQASVELRPRTVADFYRTLMDRLDALGLHTTIHPRPNELPDPIPFAEDETHRSYDPEAANRFQRALAASARVMSDFRGRFIGKTSPVHFFWGSFDLAVTRFSGRRAPPHPGGIPNLPDWVGREAYSHECCSAGFWPGNDAYPQAAYYAYAYPSPERLKERPVQPDATVWSAEMGEFLLPYEAVRTAADPEATLMRFLQTTYEAVADEADWDRAALEWTPGTRPVRPVDR